MTTAPVSRTIYLSGNQVLIRGDTNIEVLPVWPAKDPTTITARGVDFTMALSGRLITSVQPAASGVDILGATISQTRVDLVIGGGVNGTTARVELRALCADGTNEPAAILLPIVAQLTLPPGDPMPATQTITTIGTNQGVFGPLPVFAPPGASVIITGTIVARNVLTDDTVSWDVRAVIKGLGTSGASIDQQNVTPYQTDPAMVGCTASVTVNEAAILLPVLGLAETTVMWSLNVVWNIA